MSLSKLERMRAKLKEKASNSSGDQASFPFWDMAEGTTTTVRFLPDKDESNDWNWAERSMFKWEFGDPTNPTKKIKIQLPCREMYDGPKSCAIVNDLRPFYKTGSKDDEDFASKFWPKKSFIYQGFIRRTSIVEQSPPENKIRILVLNRKIHEFIKNSILSDDPDLMFKHDPFGLENGTNFLISKKKDGRYASYDSSQWSSDRYTSQLTDDEKACIERFGLWELKSRLPARPSEEAFKVMYEMFKVAVDGGDWRPEWEKHFRPWRDGPQRNGGEAPAQERPAETTHAPAKVETKIEQPKAEQPKAEVPAEEKKPTVDTSSVLAKLKARNAARSAS